MFWDMIKKTDLRCHTREKWTEIGTKGREKLANETILENFQSLGKQLTCKYMRHVEHQIDMTSIQPFNSHIIFRALKQQRNNMKSCKEKMPPHS